MAEAEDRRPLWFKRKAITALLPCAVWRERNGQPEMFDTVLHAIRASKTLRFMWSPANRFVSTLLSEASPRAIVLASPHINWHELGDMGDLVRYWTVAASAVPYSEEIAQGVVDMLLLVIAEGGQRSIPADLWSWLAKRPSLPPICEGHHFGTRGTVIETVRALKDIEILKSYLLVVWSEWGLFSSDDFRKMCALIREDFGGIEMRHHRTDLIQHLNHVFEQLDRGLEHIQRHNPGFNEHNLQEGKNQYGELREMLLEMNGRTPFTDYAPLYTDSYPGCTGLNSSPAPSTSPQPSPRQERGSSHCSHPPEPSRMPFGV